jgi:predicted transposase YbfD/YdcC
VARKIPVVLESVIEAFAEVEDPRIDRRKLHPLMNVLVMALSGALAGTSGWDELALFAKTHAQWFETFLEMPHGVPSADTFRRVFEVLEPRELEAALQQWTRVVSESLKGEVVAIDGKSLKGAVKKAGSTTPLHLLHVWATGQRLLLGQQRVAGAPGEVAAIPEVLKRVRIAGAIVTTDANGCTKTVTAAVREAKADYVLALKGNRGPLHEQAIACFKEAEARDFANVQTHRSTSEGHGRSEERVVRVIPLQQPPDGWCDLKSIASIDRTRTIAGKTTTERSYYITSLGSSDPAQLAHAIRAHWGIENQLHWLLDVAFDEDSCRIRDERAAENHALVSRLALMMLKKSPEKLSINLKRKKAAWDPAYLTQLLTVGLA